MNKMLCLFNGKKVSSRAVFSPDILDFVYRRTVGKRKFSWLYSGHVCVGYGIGDGTIEHVYDVQGMPMKGS